MRSCWLAQRKCLCHCWSLGNRLVSTKIKVPRTRMFCESKSTGEGSMGAAESFKEQIRSSQGLERGQPRKSWEMERQTHFLARQHTIKSITDLKSPWKWYPLARSIKRKIIFHSGPTNSGKTHQAFKGFLESQCGVYCGPLRLLAWEMYERANSKGIPCDLITGEERKSAFGQHCPANHSARTVEMCPTDISCDCAIIDEIQILRDRDRGHAWTRAILGVPAKEVHICGESAALSIVTKLVKHTNDDLEVREYARKTPLTVQADSLGHFSRIEEGDCVVCFSQKDIFRIRSIVERVTRFKTAVVYGALPPAVRLQQAAKFNDPKDKCKVLIASDAIGMGLNLNIQRIIFSTLEKFDGVRQTYLTPYHTKQIAGRAGRYGSRFPQGYVTTFHDKDHYLLRKLMKSPQIDIKAAGIWPTFEQVELLSKKLPNATLSELIDVFAESGQTDDCNFFCNPGPFKMIAKHIERVSLTLEERYTFCQAPVDLSSGTLAGAALLQFAGTYSQRRAFMIRDVKELVGWKQTKPQTLSRLQDMESVHHVLNLYRWLSNRFKIVFCDALAVHELQLEIEDLIQKGLKKVKVLEKSSGKSRNLKGQGIITSFKSTMRRRKSYSKETKRSLKKKKRW